jgi:hypothetical protein
MEEKYFKKEKQFLKTYGKLLSRLSYLDSLTITPELFEKNSKLINSVIYKDIISSQPRKTEIKECIILTNENYYIYFSRKLNESRYNINVYYNPTRPLEEITFLINQIIKTQ